KAFNPPTAIASAYIGKMLDGDGLATCDSRYARPPSERPKLSVEGKSAVGTDALGKGSGRGQRKCTASSFLSGSPGGDGGKPNECWRPFRRPFASTELSSRTIQSVAPPSSAWTTRSVFPRARSNPENDAGSSFRFPGTRMGTAVSSLCACS